MKGHIFRPAIQALAVLFVALFLAGSGTATTAILLTDDELITSSRVIVIGEIRSVKSQWDFAHQNIYTYVKVQVSQVLKGQLQNQTIVFKQLGGTVGEDSNVIFGAPSYEAGRSALLFLDTSRDGTLRIAHLFQGKYDVRTNETSGELRIERKIDKADVNLLGATEGPNITNEAGLGRFTRKIKRVLQARSADVSIYDSRFDGVPIVETPPEYVDDGDESHGGEIRPLYTFLGNFRWFQPDTGQPVAYRVNPNAAPRPNGGTVEINQALAAWSNVQTTSLVLQNIGSTTAAGFLADGVTALSYDDPLDQMSDPVGCSGTLAIGGVTSGGGGTIVIGGITFRHIFEGDVVFNRNFQCFLGISANLAEVATHEIGHSIGFDHSSDPAAIMWASAHGNGRGATLGTDDVAAVSFLYPGSHGGQSPPAAPGSLSATAASSSAINLSWADNSNNETGFRLERKTGAGGTYDLIASPAAGQTSYPDSGLQASTTYFYRIKAYNTAGESAYSNEASATTSPAAGSNNAAFVSQSVPTAMSPGQVTGVSIVMRNTGTTTWAAGTYFLGSQNPAGNTRWGTNRVNLTVSVAPNAQVTLNFNVTAPTTPGSYNFQWQMASDAAGSFGALTTNVVVTVSSTPRKTPADFDGDGRSDIGYYRNGVWGVLKSSLNYSFSSAQFFSWGGAGLNPIIADFDGDGRADLAYIVPPSGSQSAAYAILKSSTNYNFNQPLYVPAGLPSLGDTPVVGDFDGDGKADPGIWRSSTGAWMIPRSSSGYSSFIFTQWGQSGDTPVVGDFDGDGRSDIGYYRNGVWGVLKSSQNYSFSSAQFFSWGGAGLKPIIADFDGDGRADICYIVPPSGSQSAAYAILKSSTNYNFSQPLYVPAGLPSLGDTPVVGDFDGDGKADPGIWRASVGAWMIPRSSSGYSSFIFTQWGQNGDTPMPNSP